MVNLAEFTNLFAMGTSSTYGDYRVNRAKYFFMGFFIIVAIVLILGFINELFKKSPQKGVEPPMPSSHTIRPPVK